IGGVTAVATKPNVPAALNYEISVTPDANSASGYADGIVSTTFTVSVMEGRYDGAITPKLADIEKGDVAGLDFYDNLTSTLTYIDTATVAGGISAFNKVFGYQSGITCTNC
ncbi:MAG: hypothetical protein FWF19_05830, partial [Euryarchaeota archaeon]|nr:hypothetical protein [Euryarchaeota archaeon]